MQRIGSFNRQKTSYERVLFLKEVRQTEPFVYLHMRPRSRGVWIVRSLYQRWNAVFFASGLTDVQFPRVRMLNRDPGINVTGSVPDVRPYLAKARVAVTPLRIARGIQNKVLEAMAMGVPVVGTAEAFGGIHAGVADGVRVANDPIGFAREVLCLLGDREFHSRCFSGGAAVCAALPPMD